MKKTKLLYTLLLTIFSSGNIVQCMNKYYINPNDLHLNTPNIVTDKAIKLKKTSNIEKESQEKEIANLYKYFSISSDNSQTSTASQNTSQNNDQAACNDDIQKPSSKIFNTISAPKLIAESDDDYYQSSSESSSTKSESDDDPSYHPSSESDSDSDSDSDDNNFIEANKTKLNNITSSGLNKTKLYFCNALGCSKRNIHGNSKRAVFNSDNIQKHIRQDHPNRTFVCNICYFTYTRACDLCNHRQYKHKHSKIPCRFPNCAVILKNRTDRGNHEKKVHGCLYTHIDQ